MKRFSLVVAAAAAVTLLAAGCGSDSDSTESDSQSTSVAAQNDSLNSPEPEATGDVYQDTCNGVLTYIQTMQESGAMGEGRTPQSIGEEFLSYAKTDPAWAGKSDQVKADFERGVNAGVDGSC